MPPTECQYWNRADSYCAHSAGVKRSAHSAGTSGRRRAVLPMLARNRSAARSAPLRSAAIAGRCSVFGIIGLKAVRDPFAPLEDILHHHRPNRERERNIHSQLIAGRVGDLVCIITAPPFLSVVPIFYSMGRRLEPPQCATSAIGAASVQFVRVGQTLI